MKKIKDLEETCPLHISEYSILFRCQFPPILTYGFNTIPIKTQLFVEIYELILKCMWKSKGPGIDNFEKEQNWKISTT